MSGGPDVCMCESISWGAHHAIYWLNLNFSNVTATFDAVGLYHIMLRCADMGVEQPSDLVGKLFELRFQGRHLAAGLAGDVLEAIRPHPGYAKGKEGPWLRSQVVCTGREQREQTALYLEIVDE